ncbi:MAG: bifunctional methylenetetrahydrofolate dehydrogenase/methenyltetrahydrofolate cyclohydrolase FolD [Bacillota bacterium]
MSQIIDGKALSKSIRAEVKKEVESLREKHGKSPHLVVVLVGDNPASETYVRMKHKACEKAGIKSTTINKDASIKEDELLRLIHELNHDDDVHGILVQLPLPKHIDANKVINTIAYQKDVDGFHPMNIAALQIGTEGIIPATPKGIMTLLDHTGIKLEGKNAVIIGRSNIVGKPVAQLLLKANATVTIAHSRTRNLSELAASADVLVAAVGRPKMVTADMVKEGATVIDVGVNRIEGKLVGDVDFENVKDKAANITPVPGGVGPMTIASLLENTVECFKSLEK